MMAPTNPNKPEKPIKKASRELDTLIERLANIPQVIIKVKK